MLRRHHFVGSAEPGALDDPRVTSADTARALQLLTRDGRFEGYDAIRRILIRCPPTFWFAPLLWLPPARALGERTYWRIAERRTCMLNGGPQAPVTHPRRGNLIILLIALQVLVPLGATLHQVPSKLGFHMYTGFEFWQLTVKDADGDILDVDRSKWIAVPREDLDWSPRIAPVICAEVPDAAVVTVRQWETDVVTECDR